MNRKEIICRGDELFRLIPQRPPMVMIDRFYGIEEKYILVRADRHPPIICFAGTAYYRKQES